jgi:antitoxin component HigA of HigAB toxin-antitoxin module
MQVRWSPTAAEDLSRPFEYIRQENLSAAERSKRFGREVLRELMAANGLRQKDLDDDLGDESIVSVILQEKRQLKRRQMEKLSHRFHVSPAVFF